MRPVVALLVVGCSAILALGCASSNQQACALPASGSQAQPTANKVAEPAPKADGFTTISVDQLAQKIEHKDPVAVFDANNQERYNKGHIPGAKWVDANKLEASVLPQDKSTEVVFYCANTQCKASHRAANQASSFGYKRVQVLPEGIVGWEQAGKPVEK